MPVTERIVARSYRRLKSGGATGHVSVLGISGSRKPGPGRDGRSASAGLLDFALNAVGEAVPDTTLLDLRELELPFFDGRKLSEWQSADLSLAADAVRVAGSLLVSVPAYWGGAAGVFKNFLDLLGGAHYDDPNPMTIFAGKPFGLIVVGADFESAALARTQIAKSLVMLGAVEVADAVSLRNPRLAPWNDDAISAQLLELAASVAKAGLSASVN